MKDLLPFLVVGLSTGSIYGLAGIGLVLTYRTAGVFNFAHGAVAALGAYAFYELRTTHGWPWPVALVVSVLAVAVVGGATIAWLTRYLAGARTEMQLVATVGLLLFLLVVQAFGACAIGLFSSLPLTYAGGLVVGVASALTTKYGTTRVLQGLGPSVPFLILFVALLVVPARRLATQARTFKVKPKLMLPKRPRRALAGTAVVVLALVPWIVDVRLTSYTAALAMVPAFLSLGVLVYMAGSISLCHAAFAALGATTFAHFSHAGLPWLLALVGAGLAVMPLGAVVAIPAIRLQGIYLALATFGFGILLEKVLYPAGVMFGSIGARQAPRPHFWGINGSDERGFYLVVLLVAIVTTLLVVALIRNRIGRLLVALGDSPPALP